MAKMRQTAKGSQSIMNLAGGKAYKMPNKTRFVTRVMTSLVNEPKYYGDTTNDLIADAQALMKSDAAFVAKTAIYAREKMHLRTVPVLLTGLLGLDGKKYVRRTINRVCTRPDQLKDLVAFYNIVDESGKLARSLKQVRLGVQDVFCTFDEYQLAKYNNSKDNIKMKDVFNLYHPSPTNSEQFALFGRLLKGTLKTPYTWETELSKKGNTREVWESIIDSGKLPYMAALRNLNNIIKVTPSNIDKVLGVLSDEKNVLRSKQFPYRFFSAYATIDGDPFLVKEIKRTLNKCIEISVSNVPSLSGRTFMSADNSGSMDCLMSGKSIMTYKNVANIFQAMMVRSDPNSITSVFGGRFKVVDLDPDTGILHNADILANTDVDHSTHAYLAIEYLTKKKLFVDRIIIFSDMQVYDLDGYPLGKYLDAYRKINPNVWLHCIDLAGYGTSVDSTSKTNVNLIAGWSDNVLHYIPMVELGANGMVSDIENISL